MPAIHNKAGLLSLQPCLVHIQRDAEVKKHYNLKPGFVIDTKIGCVRRLPLFKDKQVTSHLNNISVKLLRLTHFLWFRHS